MARILGGFSRATAALLSGRTTIAGRSWVPVIDTTNVRLVIFDGETAGGVSMARLDEVQLVRPLRQIEVPTDGATVTHDGVAKVLILNPAGPLATLTVQMVVVEDGTPLRIASRQRIDALTILPAGAEDVDWSANELPAQGKLDFLFDESLNAWVQA